MNSKYICFLLLNWTSKKITRCLEKIYFDQSANDVTRCQRFYCHCHHPCEKVIARPLGKGSMWWSSLKNISSVNVTLFWVITIIQREISFTSAAQKRGILILPDGAYRSPIIDTSRNTLYLTASSKYLVQTTGCEKAQVTGFVSHSGT